MAYAYRPGVRLRPRLEAAARLIHCETVADIGCDHGRLGVALLQRGNAKKVIAADVSPDSLAKARALSEKCGVPLALRCGDGLEVLSPGEAQAIIMAGMGGTLIAELLARKQDISRGPLLVLQPMTAAEDLRYYLFTQGYDIVEDTVVADGGRYYQLLAAKSGTPAPRPKEWPQQIFSLGWVAYAKCDPLLPALVEKYLHGVEKRVRQAAPAQPMALLSQLEGLLQIRALIQERY